MNTDVSHSQGKILIAEDNSINLEFITLYLMQKGYHVVGAQNGLQALEFFKKEKFSLIIMDLQMPIMDGYTAVTEIRKLENGAEPPLAPTPIVALTAYGLQEYQDRCQKTGFNDFLLKPISFVELQRIIEKYLKKILKKTYKKESF